MVEGRVLAGLRLGVFDLDPLQVCVCVCVYVCVRGKEDEVKRFEIDMGRCLVNEIK